jgi:aryl-alcohol dehydrogenase-like predicted oxidoreductase
VQSTDLRPLGESGIQVSAVALGCWPISGMTSLDVNDDDSIRTVQAALDAGVNFLDTAYGYGANGESERLIGRALRGRRDEAVIATKCGLHWDERVQRVLDARPERIRREIDESLMRLETDRVELLYLHAPDGRTPLAETAGALREIVQSGKARAIGVSNFSVQQLEEFTAVCPIAAHQPPYNMLQRQIESDSLPWCRDRGIAVVVYWPLMKGLLAGQLARDHTFAAGDGRSKYPQFQGEEYRKNQDLVDRLREIAAEAGKSVAQVVVNWTIHQPGVTAALCGAKRDHQIVESAGAMGWRLSDEHLARIEAALRERGEPRNRSAV